METLSNTDQAGMQPDKPGVELSSVKGNRGGARPGAGRPKGSGSSSGKVVNPPRSDEDKKLDCEEFVETAIFLFESGDEFVKRSMLTRLKRYVKEDAKVIEFELEIMNKYGTTETDRDRLRKLLLRLALKYPILQKVGPEVGLLVFMVQYGVKQMNILRAIETLKPKANSGYQPTEIKPATSSAN